MPQTINYHQTVSRLLTDKVRKGATIISDAGGIHIEHSLSLYSIELNTGLLVCRRVDEYGRLQSVVYMDEFGNWKERPQS